MRVAFEEGRQLGLVSLRRKQFSLAGINATMGVWLGRQYLGQREVVTNELTGRDGGPVEIDLSRLTKAERDELRQLLGRARSSQSSGDPQ